jgi:hypothetical protein
MAAAAARLAWRRRVDAICAAACGSAAACFAVWRFAAFDFSTLSSVFDLWFEGDSPRIIAANLDRWSTMHYRTSVHPLFSLFVSLPLNLIAKSGLDSRQIESVFVGGSAFLFAFVFYAAARSLGLQRIGALATTALMLSTSAAMFWLGVPETYALGGVTMLIPLIWLASPRGKYDGVTAPIQSALSLSMTVTNWMAGLTAAVLGLGVRRALQASIAAFVAVVVLSLMQQALFPHAGRFFDFTEEARYTSAFAARVARRAAGLLGQPLLAPDPLAVATPPNGAIILRFDGLSLFTGRSPAVWATLIGWAGLFALAIEAIVSKALPARLGAFLGVVIAGQLLLHLLYGEGFFLYALHFTPLLALAAGSACLGARKILAYALIAVTTGASAVHNLGELDRATALFNSYPERVLQQQSRLNERGATMLAMHERPSATWPNGLGHIVWGAPGSPLPEKGYLEVGGSFTPRPGGPGLSLWVFSPDGALEATSDQQTSPNARQRFAFPAGDVAPAVVIETPHYQLTWRQTASNHWRLSARARTEGSALAVNVRAVGPASGPIRDIAAEGGDTVRADQCWLIRARNGRVAYLGEDGGPGWRDVAASPSETSVHSAGGWAAARLMARGAGSLEAEVIQTCAPGAPPRWPLTNAALRVTPQDLPIASLITVESMQLLMGFEGAETRPGDPIVYRSQWLRDGGYSIVALARARRLDVLRDLITPFVRQDFFGGFGSEADAPGISLWAINEASIALRDPAFDRMVWPHVRRKADLILGLLRARTAVRIAPTGPVSPQADTDLVAEPAVRGLINGRMDWQRPLLFVNAFAWRGLEDAASLADRLGSPEDAARWRAAALRLRAAWRLQFRLEGIENERTAASLLWPTRVAALDERRADALLSQSALTYRERPKWTYFEVARAHQDLVLGHADRAWSRIGALLAMSPMPDLGVMWEGNGGEDSPWRDFRGWVNSPPLMPHYWSAAELLLFAIEGLAYVDETPERALVIGTGIRRPWLARPISVSVVGSLDGPVDWRWDGRAVTVTTDDPDIPIRLGPSFDPDTPIVRVLRSRDGVQRQ